MRTKSIELWTYGSYDELNDVDFGYYFEVPVNWLQTKLSKMGYENIGVFVDEYTWDTTMVLMEEAEEDGVLLSQRCGAFGHRIR